MLEKTFRCTKKLLRAKVIQKIITLEIKSVVGHLGRLNKLEAGFGLGRGLHFIDNLELIMVNKGKN